MRIGRILGIGVLVLAAGCATKPFEKKLYMCGDKRAGTVYIARTPSGYTEYIDGTCSADQDDNLDEKRVYVNRKTKVFRLPVTFYPIVEHVVLTDNPEMVRRYTRREYDPDIGRVVDRAKSYVLRNSEDGQRLQDEFEGVKASTPQN